MNKTLVSIVLVVLALIGGGVFYLLSTDDVQQAEDQMSGQNDNAQPVGDDSSGSGTQSTGVYVDYEENIVANTEGTKLLFFHAQWCPQCRALEADIERTGVPSGVTIIKVDYDSNQQLRQRYGVTLQTTVVRVNDAGELVKKFVAYGDPTLAAVIENVL